MEKLKSIEHYHKVISGKAVLMISAAWCPDCRFVDPFIDDVAANSDYKFFYVDRDEFFDLCRDLDVMGIPSFIAFENGRQVGRFVSGARKTRAQIEDFLSQLPLQGDR